MSSTTFRVKATAPRSRYALAVDTLFFFVNSKYFTCRYLNENINCLSEVDFYNLSVSYSLAKLFLVFVFYN